MSYHYATTMRRPGPVAALIGLWLGLAAIWIGVDAHPVVIGVLWACTLPLAWEIASAARYGLTIDAAAVTIHAGRTPTAIPLDQIDHAVLSIRLDFSRRLRIYRHGARPYTPPPACLPPADALQGALQDAGIRVERRLFQLMN